MANDLMVRKNSSSENPLVMLGQLDGRLQVLERIVHGLNAKKGRRVRLTKEIRGQLNVMLNNAVDTAVKEAREQIIRELRESGVIPAESFVAAKHDTNGRIVADNSVG